MVTEGVRLFSAFSQLCRISRPNRNLISNQRAFSTVLNEERKVEDVTKPAEGEPIRPDSHSEGKPRIPSTYRFQYPEFLPDPKVNWRNPLREKLERMDMINRRKNIVIPEFYVGSILAVTITDKHAPGKVNKFVGICIQRTGCGLRANFMLRNVVDHQGIDILYDLYSPLIQKIDVLRLEKRLDSELFYLRDAPNEFSTFPFDMEPEFRSEKSEVPINTIKIKLNPPPWLEKYERQDLKGIDLGDMVPEKRRQKAAKLVQPWVKYDLMDQYRATIPEEEQREVFSEIFNELQQLEQKRKIMKKKKIFSKPMQLKQM